MEAPILRLDRHSLHEPHILPAVPRVSLEIVRGRVRERKRQIAGKVFLIGAASDCDLVLGDLSFPEAYAYIFVSGTDVTIRRLGAGPALAVCGEQVESAELFHGDLVELGPFELRVVIDHPPRRGRHDQPRDWHEASERDDDERQDAIDEVRALLADIRQALAGDTASVRLYHQSQGEPAASPVHEAIGRARASA